MGRRVLETEMSLIGMEEYVAGIEKITAALQAAIDAKKEFDTLFAKVPDSMQSQTSSSSAPQ